MKYSTLIITASLISFNAFAQSSELEKKSKGDYAYSSLGPWGITTLDGDRGEGFILLDRENWGAISMDSILGNRNVTIQGKSSIPNTGQMIRVFDSDNDGEFDIIEITNDKPEFAVMQLRLIDGAWQMKSLLEWHESSKNN